MTKKVILHRCSLVIISAQIKSVESQIGCGELKTCRLDDASFVPDRDLDLSLDEIVSCVPTLRIPYTRASSTKAREHRDAIGRNSHRKNARISGQSCLQHLIIVSVLSPNSEHTNRETAKHGLMQINHGLGALVQGREAGHTTASELASLVQFSVDASLPTLQVGQCIDIEVQVFAADVCS